MARKVVAKITLRHPVQLVEGNSDAGFVLTELSLFDPDLGDMLDIPTNQQDTIGQSVATWSKLTGQPVEILKKLKPYDVGQLATHAGALLAPFVQGALEAAKQLGSTKTSAAS